MRLRTALEGAFTAYIDAALTTAGATATVVDGHSAADKSVPLVVCSVRSIEEDPPFSGNYRATCTIEVKEAHNTTADTLGDAVRNAIWASDLHTQLVSNKPAGAALTIWGASAAHRIEYDTSDDVWVETHTVEVICAASNFS